MPPNNTGEVKIIQKTCPDCQANIKSAKEIILVGTVLFKMLNTGDFANGFFSIGDHVCVGHNRKISEQ